MLSGACCWDAACRFNSDWGMAGLHVHFNMTLEIEELLTEAFNDHHPARSPKRSPVAVQSQTYDVQHSQTLLLLAPSAVPTEPAAVTHTRLSRAQLRAWFLTPC